MGTGGAALATIISQFISFWILVFNSNSSSNIRIKFKNFTPEWEMYREILRAGLPSFYRQALGSVAMIFLNFSAGVYGDAAIAAMSIVGRIIFFAISAMLGIGQGFQPVCGFNYGAKLYDRVLKAFYFTAKISIIILLAVGLIGVIGAESIVTFFRKEDLEVIEIGTRALRYQSMTLPLSAWIIMTNMLVQIIGKSREASIIAVARQGLFFIPAVLILPRIIGILGLQLSQPIADIFTFLLALFISKNVLNELKSLQKEQ